MPLAEETSPSAVAPPRKMSPVRWVIGVSIFALVLFGSAKLGLYLRGGPPKPVAPNPISGAITFVLGLVLLTLAAVIYAAAAATACFTFDFSRPIFKSFQRKLRLVNLLVGILVPGGIAWMTMPFLYPTLMQWLPAETAMMASVFGPFILMQLLLIWVNVMGPIMPVAVRRRLRGRGLDARQIAEARVVGISDPDRKRKRRLGLVEDDLGGLWIGERELVYWGDVDSWQIPHDWLIAVERRVSNSSVSAYFGAVHVVLRFRDANGVERTIRLHSEGEWTQTAGGRGLDQIGDRLAAWKENPRAGWVDRPSGFEVEPAKAAR